MNSELPPNASPESEQAPQPQFEADLAHYQDLVSEAVGHEEILPDAPAVSEIATIVSIFPFSHDRMSVELLRDKGLSLYFVEGVSPADATPNEPYPYNIDAYIDPRDTELFDRIYSFQAESKNGFEDILGAMCSGSITLEDVGDFNTISSLDTLWQIWRLRQAVDLSAPQEYVLANWPEVNPEIMLQRSFMTSVIFENLLDPTSILNSPEESQRKRYLYDRFRQIGLQPFSLDELRGMEQRSLNVVLEANPDIARAFEERKKSD